MRTGLGFLFLRRQRQHFLSLPSFFQPADPSGRDTGMKPSPDALPIPATVPRGAKRQFADKKNRHLTF